MGLNKYRIGLFVEPYSETCNIPNLTVNDVSGVNRDKEFFEPSKQVGSNTSKYKVVPPGYFACNLMHVGRDEVLPVALNHSEKRKIVSPAYTVFKIVNEDIILKDFFFIFLNSNERDRYFWFHTDSSVRDGMSWDVFCNLEIEIPDINIQRKYVDIYLGIQENYDSMRRGIEKMESTCDAYMEKLLQEEEHYPIGEFICEYDCRNDGLELGEENVRGISTLKEFIPTKANMNGVSLKNYKIVKPGTFAYVSDTSRRGDKMSLSYNNSEQPYLVSSITSLFQIGESYKEQLLSEYLYMFFRRAEFDRYARYNSWGSARETITWEDFGRMEIPVPSIGIQNDLVSIFEACNERKRVLSRLEELKKNICPILVRGAVEEGGNSHG